MVRHGVFAATLALFCSCATEHGEEPLRAAAPLAAPATSRERSVREIRVKSELAYLLTLPRGYVEPSAADAPRWPLVLFLHGMGERGDDLALVARHGPQKQIAAGREFEAIVVSPQCPISSQFGWSLPALTALLDDVMERFAVDPDRVYLTGLSMGGYGTWSLACEQPERFAAIVPICGGGDPAKAVKLVGLPTWAFHGAADPVVPLAQSEAMVRAIETAGGVPKFTAYAGVDHDSWTRTYADEAMWSWLFAQRRSSVPGRERRTD
ncbi:MAG: phospholipase [Planctomycetes bacterium]|nr:phospholipase [Planctomycetota bacterium]